MKVVSHLLVICMVFSYSLMYAAPGPISAQKVITKSKRGPSIVNRFFSVLKKTSSTIFVLGIGATVFCSYLWLMHEVNAPERIKEMADQQEKIKQAFDQLQTPRDQLRAFPQMLIWSKLEFLKNIDVATAVSATVTAAAGIAYTLFSGAYALTNRR